MILKVLNWRSVVASKRDYSARFKFVCVKCTRGRLPWIGYLKWQLRTVKADDIAQPILHAYGTIKEQDAILAWDKQELLRDGNGVPRSRWDGVTMKLHPITGEEIPDPDATVELYRYENLRRAAWPEAEFIVGNPPFIGGKDMRAELGDGYAEAAWKARPGKTPSGPEVRTLIKHLVRRIRRYWPHTRIVLRGDRCRNGARHQPVPLEPVPMTANRGVVALTR